MEGKIFFKEKTNRIGQKIVAIFILATMFMVDLAPMAQVQAVTDKSYHRFTASNDTILKQMGEQIKENVELCLKSNKWSKEDIDEAIYDLTNPYQSQIRVPLVFLKSNYANNVRSFVFKDVNFNDGDYLPDFSKFNNLASLQFEGCIINDLYAFRRAYSLGYLKNVDNISLYSISKKLEDSIIKSNGSTNDYFNKQIGGKIKNFAVWEDVKYSIKYSLDDGKTFAKEVFKSKGEDLILDYKPQKNGYTLKGWATSQGSSKVVYNPGSKYTMDGSAILFAVWEEKSNNKKDTIITYYTTTTTWSWGYNGDIWVDDYEWNNWTKTKTIRWKATAWGDKEAYVAAVPDDCWFTLNGQVFYDSTGTGEVSWEIKKNGHYVATIESPLGTVCTNVMDISNIDNTPPTVYSEQTSAPAKIAQEGGRNGKIVSITANDNEGLESISLGSKTVEVSGKRATAEFEITEAGNYDLIIKDLTGNEYRETNNLTIDKNAPKIISSNIEKSTGNKSSGTNGDTIYIKPGDKIKVKLQADEEIRSIGAVNTQGGILQIGTDNTPGDVIIGDKYKMINNKEIELEVNADDILNADNPGEYYIYINGISDNFNNYIERFQLPYKIMVDNQAPEIKGMVIEGGIATYDEKAIKIDPEVDLTFNLYVSEELGANPKIEIAGKSYEAKYNKTIKVQGAESYVYVYTVTVSGGDIEVNKDGVVPIKVTNLIDYAGNKSEEKTFDNKNTAAGVYLHNGLYAAETFMIVGADQSTEITNGDLNKDGYLTSYDSYLMQKYLKDWSTYNETKQKELLTKADMDLDGKLTYSDEIELNKKISHASNSIFEEKINNGDVRRFVVYNKDNGEYVKGNGLTWSVYKFNANTKTEVKLDSSAITTSYDSTSGVFTISGINNLGLNDLRVEVESNNNKGTLELTNGIESATGIAIKGSNKTAYYKQGENYTTHTVVGDVNEDGYVTSADGQVALMLSADIGNEKYKKIVADYNGDGCVTSDDALYLQRLDLNLKGTSYHRNNNRGEYDFRICTSNRQRIKQSG